MSSRFAARFGSAIELHQLGEDLPLVLRAPFANAKHVSRWSRQHRHRRRDREQAGNGVTHGVSIRNNLGHATMPGMPSKPALKLMTRADVVPHHDGDVQRVAGGQGPGPEERSRARTTSPRPMATHFVHDAEQGIEAGWMASRRWIAT